ncbi:MAG: glutamine-hydrolyzing carbamoyl-phosphate synthase small subunit [Candidatus Undinarchaeales archaeon]|nr:glutamine-hydrolyzing carbamoyl-phosphate synthase small subunit [Candidatus Undinarchaeales archaeon]
MGDTIRLVLEDGTVYEGHPFGAHKDIVAEVVFNTAMTGYQESLTDPSYHRQILTQTYPLIGNYGINEESFEGSKVWASGMIVNNLCHTPSHYKSVKSLDEFLKEHDVPGIHGIDTRALTIQIRNKGTMVGKIIQDPTADITKIIEEIKSFDYANTDLVKDYAEVEYKDKKEIIHGQGNKHKLVMIDCGVKLSIVREMVKRNIEVTRVHPETSAEKILSLKPTCVHISNGPGNPEMITYTIKTVKELVGKVPLNGICLGNGIIAAACGGMNFKLKFGHRGGNHAVKNLKTGKVFVTSQNHSFCVDADSLKGTGLTVTETDCNDQTVEAIEHESLPIFSTQYHPEARPGPYDKLDEFDRLVKIMEKHETN